MKRSWLLTVLCCVLLLFSVTAAAQEIESQLVVYSTTGGNANWMEALIPKFQKLIREKYGKNIEVAVMPGDVGVNWTKLQAEWPAPSGDVYFVDIARLQEGIAQGYFVPVADYLTPEELDAFESYWLDLAEGYMVPVDQNIAGLVVREDCPVEIKSYNDLLHPDLYQRFTFSSPVAVSLGLYPLWAASLTLGYDWTDWQDANGLVNEKVVIPVMRKVKEWADACLTITSGSGSIRPLMQRGEAYVSFWWWSHAITEKAAGQPVRFVVPEEGVFVSGGSGYAIVSKAAHPVAAREWVRFLLSEEGLSTAFEVDHYSIIPRLDMSLPSVFAENMPEDGSKLRTDVPEFLIWVGNPEVQEKINELFISIVIEGR